MLAGWRSIWALGLLLCIVATSVAEPPQVFDIDLEAQGIADALNSLSEQTGAPVVFSYDLVRHGKAKPVKGRYTLTQALDALLQGTGLSGGLSDKGVVVVSASKPHTPQPGETSVTSDNNKPNANRSTTARKAGFAALLASIGAAFSASAEDAGDAAANTVSEVIVSAQKRGEERLQDTPIPLSVIDAQTLTDNNQPLLRDYATSVPGLAVTPNIEYQQVLSIRGVTTGGLSVPTVGVLIDDVPYAAYNEVPDIDPGDLARIEVLRGPQGTLYGANSLGGLINYKTIAPSTEGFSGRVEAGTSDVYNGAEPGFSMRAAANLPLSDTLAVRASAFTRQDPGYIDNPGLGSKGVNEVQAYGFRLAGLWRPSQDISLLVNALDQNLRSNGISEVNKGPGLGDLDQNYVAGLGGFERRTEAYSTTLKAKLGSVDFTSLSGYSRNRSKEPFDFTPFYSATTETLYGVTGTPFFDYGDYTRLSQEIRLSGSALNKLDWLLGGFYTYEKRQESDILDAATPTGQFVAQGWYSNFPRKTKEYAAFVDLTYHFTDQFDVQVGGRESHTIVSSDTAYEVGAEFGEASPVITPAESSNANTFTYLFTPRFRLSPDLMVYARIASGYRPGGPNDTAGARGIIPAQFNPDKTQNYEIGAKGDFLDHTLSVDASIYYIDWKNLQLQLFTLDGRGYQANGSGAKSEGVELSVVSKPLTGFTISAWVAYNDAVLTQDFAGCSLSTGTCTPTSTTPASSAFGVTGDRLPNSPRFSGNLSLEQSFPLWSGAAGFFGATGSFIGDEVSVFQSTPLRQTFPSYTKTDLRAGVRGESWTVNFYVNNVTDARALINGGLGYIEPNAYIYITPRTAGLSVAKKF